MSQEESVPSVQNTAQENASAPAERQRWLELRERGWRSPLAWFANGLLLFLLVGGLAIELLPFGLVNQHNVLIHTLLGLVFLVPGVVYVVKHVRGWWDFPFTHVKFTGWAAGGALGVCLVSGLVVTAQSAFGTAMSDAWRLVHALSTWATIAFLAPHLWTIVARELRRRGEPQAAGLLFAMRAHARGLLLPLAGGIGATALLCVLVPGPTFVNAFPKEYDQKPYAGASPFSPSLAMTASGGAFDARSLSGSASCGTANCHEEIYDEWKPSAHRYSALDVAFQKIQSVMAAQNGPDSTRYCAGCHDPISLFSGTKFIGVEDLTSLAGYQEGVSCLACHSIQKTDVKGNASYVIAQPRRYAFELAEGPAARFVADFMLRSYPEQHVATFSHTMFKTPEFCAACHKQFIDEEVNKVGWVQLQNQYDNWKGSRWNHPGDPQKTLECRECHMPLADSRDPAAGDSADFNRRASDAKHRSHRFLGGNQFIPVAQDLPGGKQQAELTEKWLRGEIAVPEIASRWREGPAIPIEIDAPKSVAPGEKIPLKIHILNNKVGHDFPTGPLDIIQAWIEIEVKDANGVVVFETGKRDERHTIETGTFMFKAEPVDRYGNLIDRHNLWEMVGVRFKRSLFPGAADVASFEFPCPGSGPAVPVQPETTHVFEATKAGELFVEAKLNYRKVDQYLMRFAFGEDTPLTSPVTMVSRTEARIRVASAETKPTDEKGEGAPRGGDR
ncbi:MAG: hypothetical protein HZA53_15090 [Planctomycetes bacterium]|nr:hypothetical protein [Planctomycetota bacterium]